VVTPSALRPAAAAGSTRERPAGGGRGPRRGPAARRSAEQFVVLASWTDQKAFEATRPRRRPKEFAAKVNPLLASPNDLRLHQALSVDGATAAGPARAV